MTTRLFYILILSLVGLSLDARALNIQDDNFEGKNIGDHFSWYAGDLPILDLLSEENQSLFKAGDKPLLVAGFNAPVYWYRLQVVNDSSEERTLYFFDSFNHGQVSFYIEDSLVSNILQSDVQSDRIVPLTFPANSSTRVFIRNENVYFQQMGWRVWKSIDLVHRDISKTTSILTSINSIFGNEFAFQYRSPCCLQISNLLLLYYLSDFEYSLGDLVVLCGI